MELFFAMRPFVFPFAAASGNISFGTCQKSRERDESCLELDGGVRDEMGLNQTELQK